MDKKEQILHYHRIDGLSLREIARRTGLNRKTVTRYIREYEAQVVSDPEEGIDMRLASKPKYPTRKTERARLTDAVCAEIEYWLTENARRCRQHSSKRCSELLPQLLSAKVHLFLKADVTCEDV